MATLTADQRNAIVSRCRGLLATYFTTSALRQIALDDLGPAATSDADIEFHDHLRLATLLPQGVELCSALATVLLAPSIAQETVVEASRGQLRGPIDPAGMARQAGRRTSPRSFPVRRIVTHHRTPENVLAASAAASLVGELQRLIGRTRLPAASSEAALARQLLDAAQGAIDEGPLAECSLDAVDIHEDAVEELLVAVDERWRSRRISNRAYADVATWVRRNRHRGLAADGLLMGLAYSEDFDNRLFEILTLDLVRSGLLAQGYECRVARPLHPVTRRPAMEFGHADTDEILDVYFQRADGVAWSAAAPRTWPSVTGIPDVIVAPRSSAHPIVLVDAKNRDRGRAEDVEDRVSRHATSEELHKMLGYFANFTRRCQVGPRGPAGALVYSSGIGTTEVWQATSDSGGLLCTAAIDPRDPGLDDSDAAPAKLMGELLRSIGLLGGARADGFQADAELQNLHDALGAPAMQEDGDEEEEDPLRERLNEIHSWTLANYGNDPGRIEEASRVLDLHMLGPTWTQLSADEQRFLATAEVFWADHSGATNMDFGPVVIELAKVFESLIKRHLAVPLLQWAEQEDRHQPRLETIGDIRAELQRASDLAPGAIHPKGARTVADYLAATARWPAATSLIPVLHRLNPIRRSAAHPQEITCATARAARAWMLGVGAEPAALSAVVDALDPV